ncbi:class II aldolase/adducin family protein [Atopobium sp. oral taxon 810]|uniref:class II aldolase/adducin family protein n=1 Tax=Atopobium sp. oral taxon 810 TaxID=712158 RepID=UPI0009FC4966|nr:class II aldolase/adducin family protein [Atopobium sp. oral taxon 810]
MAQPGCLVRNHGPFSWGKNAEQAVYHAKVMEEAALMALRTETLYQTSPKKCGGACAPQYLLDKHYLRKHGSNAYYGQQR